jgi:hypothetical protein
MCRRTQVYVVLRAATCVDLYVRYVYVRCDVGVCAAMSGYAVSTTYVDARRRISSIS